MVKDTCILCGKETPYDFETHIDFRTGYIEGAGQLCHECYTNGTDHTHITIPRKYIRMYPNDMELGGAVRQFYWDHYKND